jgi:hypothetical protein
MAGAAAAGRSLSAFVCNQLGDLPNPRAHRGSPGLDTLWKAQMLAAMGRSGNNLNQLLRRVNSYDFRGNPELIEMRAALIEAHAAHRKLCDAIIAQLGV